MDVVNALSPVGSTIASTVHTLARRDMLDVVAKRQDLTAPDVEIDECWNIRSQDYSFPRTFVPTMELSFSGPFVPWNIRSLDRSFPGTFQGTNSLENECS